MPRKKASHKPRVEKVSIPRTPAEISYETRLTIVILLLIFAYPLGLIFMWVWMKYWPLWLRLLISLPFVVCVVAFAFLLTVITLIIRHAATDKTFRQRIELYQREMKAYQLTVTPQAPMTPTLSPALPSGTY